MAHRPPELVFEHKATKGLHRLKVDLGKVGLRVSLSAEGRKDQQSLGGNIPANGRAGKVRLATCDPASHTAIFRRWPVAGPTLTGTQLSWLAPIALLVTRGAPRNDRASKTPPPMFKLLKWLSKLTLERTAFNRIQAGLSRWNIVSIDASGCGSAEYCACCVARRSFMDPDK